MNVRRCLIAVALLVAALVAWEQARAAETPKPSLWDWFRPLVGTWEGKSAGQPGEASVRREFQFVLGDRFLQVRNRSTYAPQEKNPKGEIHDDQGMVSYDRKRKRFIYRQFHVEGFVNHYAADSLAPGADTLTFRSEAIENIPAGFRARETWVRSGPDELIERFEMAEPGKDFEVYSEARLRRLK
jgi:hypothetical protein